MVDWKRLEEDRWHRGRGIEVYPSSFLSDIKTRAKQIEFPKVLDLGCGYAKVYFDLRKLNPKILYVGINGWCDRHYGIHEIRHLNNSFVGNLAIVCANAEKKLPFLESSFDIVLSSHLLMWIGRKNELLEECSRVVKEDGKCFVHIAGVICFNGANSSYAEYLKTNCDFYSFGKEFKNKHVFLGTKDSVSIYQGSKFEKL